MTARPSSIVSFALSAALAAASPAAAGTLQGVTFPDTATVGGKTVQLDGMGVRVAFVFVKVYVAGLYLEQKTGDAQAAVQTDEAKRMVLQFLREVTHDEMVDAMNEGFAHTASAALAAAGRRSSPPSSPSRCPRARRRRSTTSPAPAPRSRSAARRAARSPAPTSCRRCSASGSATSRPTRT